MFINVHLDKKEISTALKEYLERNGFEVKAAPLIIMSAMKGNVREPETWNAMVCDCKKTKP